MDCHHKILQSIWKVIYELSVSRNVQVFATTHSLEMIEAANEAFKNDDVEDFRFHRLYRDTTTGNIEARTYNEYSIDAALSRGSRGARMSEASPSSSIRLLVVEGAGDKYFFTKLLEHLEKQDSFEFVDCEGKQNLEAELTNILNRDDFAQISDIGIVRDNDYPENRNGTSAFAT